MQEQDSTYDAVARLATQGVEGTAPKRCDRRAFSVCHPCSRFTIFAYVWRFFGRVEASAPDHDWCIAIFNVSAISHEKVDIQCDGWKKLEEWREKKRKEENQNSSAQDFRCGTDAKSRDGDGAS